MKPTIPALRRSAVALALSFVLGNAGAVGLGEAEIHSSLGMPLRIEIPLHLASDEAVDEQCLTLAPAAAGLADPTQILGLRLRILRTSPPRVLIESIRPVAEPYVTLRLRLECGGAGLIRDYAVLVDPQILSVGNPADAASFPIAAAAVADRAGKASAADKTAGTAASGKQRARKSASSRHRVVAAEHKAPAHPALRLESGLLGLAHSAAETRAEGAPGLGTLRLETHFDAPTAVTTSLVAERGHLRDLRALLLSGDDTLDRMLTLQGQVGALEAQLRSLQNANAGASPGAQGPAMAGAGPAGLPPAPGSALSAPADASPAPGSAPGAVAPGASASPAAAPGATTPAGRLAPAINTTPLPRLQDAQSGLLDGMLDALPWIAAGLIGLAGLTFIFMRRRKSRRATGDEFLFRDADSVLAEAARHGAQLREQNGASLREPTAVQTATPTPKPLVRVAVAEEPVLGPETEADARTAYLHERFPEIAAGLIKLDEPESVVNGARLYADHGDYDHAEELLEAALQGSSATDVRPWLALFELHRMREEVSPYASLLTRFRERFGNSRYLPEVLAVGRQLDASRPDFAAPEGGSAVVAPSEATSWLSAELDFVPESLARDLHETLMAELDEPPDHPAAKAQGSSS